jgi:hypothetical protein
VPISKRRVVVIASGAVVAVAAAIVAIAVRTPAAPKPPHVHTPKPRPVEAASATAFTQGGVPLRDPEVEAVLEELCTEVTRSDGKIARGIQPAPIVAHGRDLATAWGVMTDSLADWGDRPPEQRDDKLEAQVREDLRATSDQLVAAGLGYTLELRIRRDPTTHASTARMTPYRIDEVRFVIAGGEPRSVLGIRRLDGYPASRGVLGLESTDMGPVLMLDPIAGYAITDVLPVLAPDTPFALGDLAFSTGPGKDLAALVGAAVRTEVTHVLGGDADTAKKLATLVAERAAIVDGWTGLPMHAGKALYLDGAMLARATGVSTDDRDQVEALSDQIDALDPDHIAARLETIVKASVRRHEAQHGYDQASHDPLPYPKQLEDSAGPETGDDGQPRVVVAFARAELDAYLSQLINDPTTPQLTLWGVATFAFGRSSSSPEGSAGEIIVDGVARHLGVTRPAGSRDRAWLIAAGTAITKATGDQIRAAARELWTELYDRPAIAIVDH